MFPRCFWKPRLSKLPQQRATDLENLFSFFSLLEDLGCSSPLLRCPLSNSTNAMRICFHTSRQTSGPLGLYLDDKRYVSFLRLFYGKFYEILPFFLFPFLFPLIKLLLYYFSSKSSVNVSSLQRVTSDVKHRRHYNLHLSVFQCVSPKIKKFRFREFLLEFSSSAKSK